MNPTEICKTDEGYRKYRESLLLVFFAAVNRVIKGARISVHQSVNRATYIEFKNIVSHMVADEIKAEMQRLILSDFPLKTEELPRELAIQTFRDAGQDEEAEKLRFTPRESIRLFEDSGRYYGVYGSVFGSAGALNMFDLVCFESGLLLRYPHPSYGGFPPFSQGKKIIETIEAYRTWHRLTGTEDVFQLNALIRNGGIEELVNISEIMHEKKLSDIADTIKADILNKRIVLISGPSSSGKTTFANRLMLHLRVCGITPVVIGLDDYFYDREFSPRDEAGNYDFENIECLDYERCRSDMSALIRGNEVSVPKYDFENGKSIPDARRIRLKAGEVLIIEGIHALSEKLTQGLPSNALYKVYCSALTSLCFDNFNPISPTDTRLLRRIIRDSKFRSLPAAQTVMMWDNISRGEVKNIFPYENDVNTVFNSSLRYEYAVYKPIAVPLLEEADRQLGGNYRCRRLLEMLSYFDEMDSRLVPPMSVLREFIGGCR